METKREIFSLRRDVVSEDGRRFPLVYKLVEGTGGEGYAVRCFVEGTDLDAHPYQLAEADLPQGDPEAALLLMERLAAAGVMPVHIADVLSDGLA